MDQYALTSADTPALETYLRSLHPANAVYFLERLERYGINSPWGQFFGICGSDGALLSVTMFDNNERECAVDWTTTEVLPHVASLIASQAAHFDYLIGQFSQVHPLVGLLPPVLIEGTVRGRMYCLPPENFSPYEPHPVRRASPSDAEETLAIDPTAHPPDQARVNSRRARLREYPTYVAEADGKIVSWAGVSLRFGAGANIGSVRTHPQYEHKGYCSSCMSALCRDLLPQTQRLYLSVADENDRAIRVYERLGFVPLGEDVNPRLLVRITPV